MRLGFDVSAVRAGQSGVGRSARELLAALHRFEPDVDVRLLSNRAPDATLLGAELAALPRLRAVDLPLRTAWMHTVLPVALAASDLDLCHYTNYDAPLMSRTPYAVTVHDTSLITRPETHPRRRVLLLRQLMRRSAQRANAVICPSRSARADAIAVLDLDPDRVHVVHDVLAAWFRPIDDVDEIGAATGRHGLRPGYLLYVGTIEPRKNLVRLVEAYARLRSAGFEGQLAICGAWGWKSTGLEQAIERLGRRGEVVLAGHVPDSDLVALMNGARAFAYPSLYEGFGLPVIEAMACGVPVVTSDRGATAEVAGSAALLADPESVEAIASAIGTALFDEPARNRLRTAGLARAATFGPRTAAGQAAAVYRAVLDDRGAA